MARVDKCAECGKRIDLPDSDTCSDCARAWHEYVTHEKST